MKVEVEGGELLGFGSANPCTKESYLEGQFTTYYGRSQAIIRVNSSDEFAIKVTDGAEEIKKVVDVKGK